MSNRYKLDQDMVDDEQFRFVPGIGRVRTAPRQGSYWDSRERYNSSTASDRSRYDSYRPGEYSYETSLYDSYRPRYRVGGPDDPFRSSFPSSQERAESERRMRERQATEQADTVQDPLDASLRQSSDPSRSANSATANAASTAASTPLEDPSRQVRSVTQSRNEDTDTSEFRSSLQHLNQIFAEAQRNRSSDEDEPFEWRDSRRSDEHLPGREDLNYRQVKQESDDSQNRRSLYTDSRRSTQAHRRIKREDEDEEENPMFLPESPGSGYNADRSSTTNSTSTRTRGDSRNTPSPLYIPTPPVPRPAIPGACMCPVDRQCPARANHLIDCRTLVVEWQKWNARQVDGDPEV